MHGHTYDILTPWSQKIRLMPVGRREQRHPDKGRPRRQRITVNSDNNFTQSWLTHEANSKPNIYKYLNQIDGGA